MTNTPLDDATPETEAAPTDVLSTLDEQDWSQLSDLAVLRLDLERIIGSIEHRRAQIQVQGRALTDDEQRYLDRTDEAVEHLAGALTALQG